MKAAILLLALAVCLVVALPLLSGSTLSEPASLVIFGSAMMLIAFSGRRKRQSAPRVPIDVVATD